MLLLLLMLCFMLLLLLYGCYCCFGFYSCTLWRVVVAFVVVLVDIAVVFGVVAALVVGKTKENAFFFA